MTTSLAHDAEHEDWADSSLMSAADSVWTRAQPLLWILLSVALLGAFLLFVIADYPLGNLIAVQ